MADAVALVTQQLHPLWHAQASCVGQGDLMFSKEAADMERARRLCKVCPVRRRCLAVALACREPDGIWGGLDVFERQRVQRQLPDEPKYLAL